ncbi:protease inhibitor I42 family protein [Streptomyces plumbiresistens]|uniref:Proteinase inhibitor I42 chagasin domain-containing protein n=1 Tax=Streptomyces plumbiresistens TaxID=511811 RepID=A0ABP7QF74_9ACTN
MNTRALLVCSAALSGLLALTGCGGSGGSGAPTATASVPSATASAPVAEYGPRDRAITVVAGDTFSLTLPASPNLDQAWYLTAPEPDADVLKYRGKRADYADSELDGASGGTQSFDFTALGKGTATVRLLWCPMNTCGGPTDTATPVPTATATGAPGAEAAFHVFEVTVR